MAIIVIDPGHGGSESTGGSSWNNAVGPGGTLEKTLTLEIGLLTGDILRTRGHSVHLTRTDDRNISLAKRAAVSKSNKAAAFLSLHFNGSHKHTAQGTETLVYKTYSNLSAKLSLAVQDAMLAVTGLKDRNTAYATDRIKPQ